MARPRDTIAAIATAPGRGAVGIVRVSGPGVQAVMAALCGRVLKPREATYLPFQAESGEAIDTGLALYFPGPASFTGEDVLELQAHGGTVVLQLLLARCLDVAGPVEVGGEALRIARPGEFSERAFLNGKIDLAQAEAIADLIDASTEAAARGASRSLSGEFSREINSLREALVRLRTLVEATLDFPEEEINFLRQADAQGQLRALLARLQTVLGHARQGALLREGITVVIAGQPNVGKSSLLNALAGAELAIVTPVPGTTRDKVQQTIQIEGVPIHVVDTAGLRHSDDVVEKIGIERAWAEIASADVVLFLHDLTRQREPGYVAGDDQIRQLLAKNVVPGVPVLDVWNKSDLENLETDAVTGAGTAGTDIAMSAKTGRGLDQLRARLLALAGWQAGAEGVYIARARHVKTLGRVMAHLSLAQQWLDQQAQAIELLAEELRLAHNALGEITGEFTADDLLGEIFSKFCIGK
jgi:tRNA modification GTPase